jgi:hypothetical protein
MQDFCGKAVFWHFTHAINLPRKHADLEDDTGWVFYEIQNRRCIGIAEAPFMMQV